jgi:type I restriction enzyme S subunit
MAEQRRVASILGTLDNRIELNRQMCETLEETAEALYKAWFVDFEPVRAKMEGRWREGESLQGLPAETYQLFPGQFVDSQLGTIPAEWSVGPLGDAVELNYGKALRALERKNGPIPVYGSNGQIGWHDECLVKGPGIIVGRKGNPGSISRSHIDFFPIDTTFYAVVRDAGLTFEYLYYMLRRQNLHSVTSDSAVPGLNRNLAYANLCVRPPDGVIAAFTEAVASLWSYEQSIQASSRLLGDLRDTLLPTLISGELCVPASATGRD